MNVPRNETLSRLSIRVTILLHSVIEGFSLHISSHVILKAPSHQDCCERYWENMSSWLVHNVKLTSPRIALALARCPALSRVRSRGSFPRRSHALFQTAAGNRAYLIKYTSGNDVSTHQSNPSVDRVPVCRASDQYHQPTELKPHLTLIPSVAKTFDTFRINIQTKFR